MTSILSCSDRTFLFPPLVGIMNVYGVSDKCVSDKSLPVGPLYTIFEQRCDLLTEIKALGSKDDVYKQICKLRL